jgi:hypothetical protein
MDGGAIVGGIADVTILGVLVGGTAEDLIIATITPEGGVIVDGTADESYVPGSQTYDETMDGGVVLGGIVTTSNDITGEGGAVLGGIADVTTLGILAGGSADYFVSQYPGIEENEWSFYARFNQVSDEELEADGNPSPTEEEVYCYIALNEVDGYLYYQFEYTLDDINSIRFRGPADYGELGATQVIITNPSQFETGRFPVTPTQIDEIKNNLWYVFAREWYLPDDFYLMRGQIATAPNIVSGEADITYDQSLDFGGVTVGGEAVIETPGHGVNAGGDAEIDTPGKIYEVGSGGAVVDGFGFQRYDETASAGAKIGGAAYIDYQENQCPCVPTSRVLSLNELNFLDQQIFIQELIDRSQRKGLIWKDLRVLTQFRSSEDNFEYFLTQTQFGITLDILKDGKFYGNFSSELHPKIQDLFDEVVNTTKDDRRLKETLSMTQSLSSS